MVIEQEYFTIKLTSEIDLAVALINLKTIIQLETNNICAVPGVAEFWYGVVNFKGSLLWVLDSDRFFQFHDSLQPSPKLTAIVTSDLLQRKQVAIVTRQLKGIVEIAPSKLEAIKNESHPMLRQCCIAVARTEANQIYLLDSASLLGRLHQNSTLVAT